MDSTSSVAQFASNIGILKLLGFRSITIVNGKSVTKPIDLLFFLWSVSLGVFISYLSFLSREDFFKSKSQIANYGNYLSYICSIFVSIIAMIGAFVFRHRLWDLVVDLGAIEGKVNFISIFI